MIVGVVGFISSGKGTVGSILESKYAFKAESFAKPLKDACASIFGWDRELLEGGTKESREWREKEDVYWSSVLKKPGFSPRLALQLMGTEAGRQVFGTDLWTASCINRCKGGDYVVTDTRFRNEIATIKDVGGIVVRVKRGEEPAWYNDALWQPSYELLVEMMTKHHPEVHQSEWAWVGSTFDYVIENDGTPADLERKVHEILQDYQSYEDALEELMENLNNEAVE